MDPITREAMRRSLTTSGYSFETPPPSQSDLIINPWSRQHQMMVQVLKRQFGEIEHLASTNRRLQSELDDSDRRVSQLESERSQQFTILRVVQEVLTRMERLEAVMRMNRSNSLRVTRTPEMPKLERENEVENLDVEN